MNQSKLTAIQKAQAHFQTKLAGELKMTRVEAWDLDVYFREITTLKQEAQVIELAQSGKTVEALITTIINKALDKDGKPLFVSADKAALMNEAEPSIVLNLSKALNGGELPPVEEIEKN